jgi:hypothetical protein
MTLINSSSIETPDRAKNVEISIGNAIFETTRTHPFGITIKGLVGAESHDYLHDILLSEPCRESFFELIECEGLVICKNVRSDASSYRKVRGKSSHRKLSQAEYYHHDGCSCPTKPRVVEIRMPHQKVERNISTAIAPFPNVIKAMLVSLSKSSKIKSEFSELTDQFEKGDPPHFDQWDKIQGRITRMVRREFDAEACRSFFREVDDLAQAYVEPWEMGESRLMLNSHDDLTKTMQHRRAYQKPRGEHEQNGSLVKRWTAEET